MADDYNPEALEAELDDAADDAPYEPSRQMVMILIDASPAMLEQAPGGVGEDGEEAAPRSYLTLALTAAVDIMRWRIMHAPRDEIGVMFYGAAKGTMDDAGFDGVHYLVPLNGPDIATVHSLLEFGDDEFTERVGSAADEDPAIALRNGLWAAKDRLGEHTKASKVNRRIFLFTCEVDPTRGAQKSRELLDQRLDDLHAQRTWLEVFPLAALAAPVDMTAYWNHAVYMSRGRGDDSDDEGADANDALPPVFTAGDVRAWARTVRQRTRAARATGRLTMSFPGGLAIAVKVFSLLRPEEKPKRIYVTRDTYQETRTHQAYLAPDGSVVDLVPLRALRAKSKTHADRLPRAVFEDCELKVVRAIRPAGLTLLGFKPAAAALAPGHVLDVARFVYPDERRLRGSTVAARALHHAMLRQGKVAIARLVMRTGNAPQLVALEAQQELTLEDGSQLLPPGFHMHPLPWRDELRSPEAGGARGIAKVSGSTTASEAQVEAAAALVRALSLGDGFVDALAHVDNPALHCFYDQLERLAMAAGPEDRRAEGDAGVVDETLPDAEGQAGHAPAAAAFVAAVYGDAGPGPAGRSVGDKRKAEVEAHVSEGYAERDWAALSASDGLRKLTNDQLKVYLRYHLLTLGGNKADLLARVQAHIAASETGG